MENGKIKKQLSTADRYKALNAIGAALMIELDEDRLLHLIAETACELTGAAFAAFTLRPINDEGQPLGPSEGYLFHLAAVVGVTKEQEELFRQVPLGGEGLLAPIFRHGVTVRIDDALTHIMKHKESRALNSIHSTTVQHSTIVKARRSAREKALAYANGDLSSEKLQSMGVPAGHPFVRSFLGVPLLDRNKQVRGGLLLGHSEPGKFTEEDETLLHSLSGQAAIALENARLYRLSQARAQELSAIFESISDGVILVDNQGQVVRENLMAHKLRQSIEADPDSSNLLDHFLNVPAQKILNDEPTEDTVVTLKNENKELHEYLVSSSALHPPRSNSGSLVKLDSPTGATHTKFSGAVVIWHDVTERRIRESEKHAQAHATQLEAIFEAMTDAVIAYDTSGKITQMNTAARDLLNQIFPNQATITSLHQWLPQNNAFDEDDLPLTIENWPISRLLRGEVITPANAIEMLCYTDMQCPLYLSITGGPIFDANGGSGKAIAIFRDVTERRKLERIEREARTQAEARLSLLQFVLDELPISVYLVRGNDARLVLANKAATSIWGAYWKQDEPMATFLKEKGIRIFGVDGHSLPTEHLATLRAVRQGIVVHQQQESIRQPDGTTLPVLVNAVALEKPHLNFPSSHNVLDEQIAIVVHQDVTALKEAEQMKDEFIGLAAHELRTPLAVLKGFAETLLVQTARGKGPELASWQIEGLQDIDQATTRLVELTEDLLDVTRLQAGRLALHTEPTNLVALSQRTISRLQITTEIHQISFEPLTPDVVVNIDPKRIEQVVTNLVNNAIKYSPEGGKIAVQIREDSQLKMALLSVKDHGIGIPEQQQARIFIRFARADNARMYGIGGTGLGLYLCRELVERHNGRIWFESVENQGSIFTIGLPLPE
jgi:signal transduction histidine kinase